jgi:hypothetical protein
LSHEVVVVEDRPVLDQFPGDDAIERDEGRDDGSACGRDSVVVAGVGAAIGPAAGHVVAVDDDLFEDDRLVGEPLEVGGDDGSELIRSVQFGEIIQLEIEGNGTDRFSGYIATTISTDREAVC